MKVENVAFYIIIFKFEKCEFCSWRFAII